MLLNIALLGIGFGAGWIIGARKGAAALATAKKVWQQIIDAEQKMRGVGK